MEVIHERVIALFLAGKAQVIIVRAHEYWNVNKSSVSRIIACNRDTGSHARHPGSEQKKCSNIGNGSETEKANRTK